SFSADWSLSLASHWARWFWLSLKLSASWRFPPAINPRFRSLCWSSCYSCCPEAWPACLKRNGGSHELSCRTHRRPHEDGAPVDLARSASRLSSHRPQRQCDSPDFHHRGLDYNQCRL